MTEKRQPISKKTRFEVFKRDKFTCQYCGRMAPSVVLEIDHIKPVRSGGDNSILNLVTSCFDCNRGKGKRKISEQEELKKQQQELKKLQEKTEQLKMMVEWKTELSQFEEKEFKAIEDLLRKATGGYTFSETGKHMCKRDIKNYGFEIVMEAAETSIRQYLEFDGTGEPTKASVSKIFEYVGRIANRKFRGF